MIASLDGRAEGEAKAAREAILLLLERRGIPVPPGVLAGLEAIDELSRLHELLERAMDALVHPAGQHGFDVRDDVPRSHEILERAFAFFATHLAD